MHQKEIDNSVSGVMSGVVIGLMLIFWVFYRWPVQSIATVAVCFALYGLGIVVGPPIDRYMAHAAQVEAEEKKKEEAQRAAEQERRFTLLDEGRKIASPAVVAGWNAIALLTDLERLEYLGNGRAKEFRVKYRLDADNPQVQWVFKLSDFVEADVDKGDKQFSQTKAEAAKVLERVKPANRYLDEVGKNKAYFAGLTAEPVLSDAFKAEFDKQPAMALTHPPVPAKARYPR
ncbi:hypothetical protein [Pseudomonas paralcaligenes]|uniref:hypothetical protein n=1 Tax=Pseudomonas paralcaligenes TaxID=2772558 RepID=UPI001C812C74|nr:hypothetical protein [Pseudomonas paralcaligenes]